MRLSAFLVCGTVLAATTVVSIAFWFVDPSAQYVGLGLGMAGAVAAGLGWAAHARSVWGGARRAALAAAVLFVAGGGAFVFLLGAGQFPLELEGLDLGPRRVYEYETPTTTWVVLLGVAVTAGAVGFAVMTAGLAGAATRWAVATDRHPVARLVAGALALTPLLLETASSVVGGEGQWTAICVLSLAWLVWALRRARSQRHPVADIGIVVPVPIDPGRG